MYKCVGAPFVASLPHFYLSDESYQKGVRGLNPTKDKHEIIILFESVRPNLNYHYQKIYNYYFMFS